MQFNGFPKEGVEFLGEIVANNSKEWLEANRDRYESLIVSPNRAFIEEMGEYLQILVPTIHAIPKTNKSLFRIYRDARYHLADPIKSRIGIIFWQGSGHRMQSSSFYMHYDSSELFVATGIRNFKPPLLATYREYIRDDTKREELHLILESLKSKGYELPAPHYKRYPRDFDSSKEYSYLALQKAVYGYSRLPIDDIFFSSDIVDRCFEIYRDMSPLQEWLYELTLKSSP